MTIPESIADATVIVAGVVLLGAAVWALGAAWQGRGAMRRKDVSK